MHLLVLVLLVLGARRAQALDVLVSLFYTAGSATLEQTYIIPHPGIGVAQSFATEPSLVKAQFQLHMNSGCSGSVLLLAQPSGTLQVPFFGNQTVTSGTLSIPSSADTVSVAVRCSLQDVSVQAVDDVVCLNKTLHGWQSFGEYTDRSSFLILMGVFAAVLFAIAALTALQIAYFVYGRRVRYLS